MDESPETKPPFVSPVGIVLLFVIGCATIIVGLVESVFAKYWWQLCVVGIGTLLIAAMESRKQRRPEQAIRWLSRALDLFFLILILILLGRLVLPRLASH